MNVYDAHALAASAVNAHAGRPATALAHDSADARVVIFRIGPGQAVPIHTSTSTVLLLIVSGAGSVMGPGGERSVKPGDIVAYDVQEPHGMRSDGEELIIAAVIAPRPGAA